MRNTVLFVAVTVVAAGVFAGCTAKPKVEQKKGAKAGGELPALCAKCGQFKGTDECCKPDVEKCAKCGLAKGAPGCCKLPKDANAPVALCAKCGQIKGADECCKAEADTCKECGLAVGSPGHLWQCRQK